MFLKVGIAFGIAFGIAVLCFLNTHSTPFKDKKRYKNAGF